MYRRLLLASVSFFAMSAAQGAQLYWTGAGADNLWSNNDNWGSPAAPGADDGAHLMDEYGSAGSHEVIELEAGQDTVGSLFVEGSFYELTDDGQNLMLDHGLIVANTLSVDEGLILDLSGVAHLTAQGSVDLGNTSNAIELSDFARFTLDGAELDDGTILLEDQASLEVFQTGSTVGGITGGYISFYDSSSLEANETSSVTGGYQYFSDLSYLYANAASAVDGGEQVFFDSAQLRAVAAGSVTGGLQTFEDNSQLILDVTGAVGNTTIELRDNASIVGMATDGMSDTTDVGFSTFGGGAGGTLLLNGYNQVVGTINSVDGNGGHSAGGSIVNGGAAPVALTVGGDGDSVFGGLIADGAGAGSLGLVKQGVGRLYLQGASTYTGQTTVTEGLLSVNGDISSSSLLYVTTDGTLGGDGTVGATNIEGGTLRPGYYTETLAVDGNLAMDGAATYEVDIRGTGDGVTTSAARVDVSGTLELTGNPGIYIWNYGYTYTAGTQYTIATASAITGAFDANLANAEISPFLHFVLGQDATSVHLTVERAATLASVAGTPNQAAVAGVVDGLPDGSPLFDMIASLDEAGALDALDQFSGDLHATLKGGLIEDSRFLREASLGRLDAPGGDGAGLWVEAYGGRAVWQGDGNAAETTRDAKGLFAGADGTVGDWRFGALLGYGQSGYGVIDRGASASVDSYQAGVYAGTVEGPLLLRGGLAYAANQVATERDIVIADPDFATSLEAGYGGATTQAFGEIGYGFEAGPATFTPFAGLVLVNAATGGFTETGGTGALSADAQSVTQTYASLGLKAEAEFMAGTMSATLHGSLAWRHAFGAAAASTFAFAEGGDAFTVSGVPMAQDAALVEAGIDLAISETATAGVSYSGVITESSADQAVKGELSVKF